MSVFRIEKNKNYTVMSNYHLRDKNLNLKTKGLLSVMLSLPEDWDYTETGLSIITGEGRDSIRKCLKQLEEFGYLSRERVRDENGRMKGTNYIIREMPENIGNLPKSDFPTLVKPTMANPTQDKPMLDKPISANAAQLNNNKSITDLTNNRLINPSINPRVQKLFEEDGWMDGPASVSVEDKFNAYEKIIRENINYDLFEKILMKAEKDLDDDRISLDQYEKDIDMYDTRMLNTIKGYMLDILCGESTEPISVNGNLIPREMVKSKLLKIDHNQMARVIYELNTNKTIKNRKNYSISMLYNS